MATLAKLVVEMGLDDKMSSGLAGAADKVGKFGQSLTDVGEKMLTRFTLPILGGFGFAVKSASDLNESMSAVSTVFGKNASDIQNWSKNSAQALGISQAAALSAASSLGALFTGIGMSTDKAAEFSKNVLQAASDLGSFYNVDPGTAMADLQSGLVGQYEPLRKYGIVLSEAVVQQEALRQTGKASADQLTEGEKVAARYSLIMAGLGSAAGDFARTADSQANSQRIANAEFRNAAAALGVVLLPYVTQATQAFSDLMQRFQSLSPETQKFIVIAGLIVAAIGPALIIIGQMAAALPVLGAAFAILTGPVGLVIAAIAALAIAYQTNFMGFADGVNSALAGLATAFAAIVPTFEAFKNYISAVVTEGDTLNDWLTHLPTQLQPVAIAIGEAVAAFQSLIPYLEDTARLIGEGFQAVLPTFTSVMKIIGTLALQTVTSLVQIFTGLVTAIKGIMQVIKGIFTGDWGLIKTGVTNIVTGIKDIVVAIFNGLKAQLIAVLAIYKTVFSDAWNAIKDTVINAVTGAVDGAVGKLTAMKDTVYNAAYNAGYAIGQGVIAGVNAIWNSIMSFLDSLISAIWDKIKAIGDIDVPLPDLPGWVPGSVQSAAGAVGLTSVGMNGGGSRTNVGGITINVNGAGDPRAVADEVFSVFEREMRLLGAGA